MSRSLIGVCWALAFVILESTQYVYFGGVFQNVSSLLFGFLAFGIVVVVFVGRTALLAPEQLKRALANPAHLIGANVAAALAWMAYLGSVQLIEPAVAYTIGAGVMPITAWVAYRMGVPEGEPMRNLVEAYGNLLIVVGIIWLGAITVLGWSGFVRGDASTGIIGVALAIADGVLFTWMLIYCQRLDRVGVLPTHVFGLRFPLYVLVAGGMVGVGVGKEATLPMSEIMTVVAIGLALTVPPLLALQKAVSLVSTLTIGAITALGPFVIFGLQIVEGRVDYSPATLIGLTIYIAGAVLAAIGAVRASMRDLAVNV